MSQPADNVTPIDLARARRMLRDMTEKPFALLLFDGDKVTGIVKDLTVSQIIKIEDIIEGCQDS